METTKGGIPFWLLMLVGFAVGLGVGVDVGFGVALAPGAKDGSGVGVGVGVASTVALAEGSGVTDGSGEIPPIAACAGGTYPTISRSPAIVKISEISPRFGIILLLSALLSYQLNRSR